MTAAMTERRSKTGSKTTPPAVERERGGRARSVSEMLPDVGRAAFRQFGFIQSSIVSRWAEIVGPRYAEASAPEAIRFPPGRRSEGVLHLVVASAHAPMMQHVAPAIIERVNRFFGYPAVARLAIRQGMIEKRAARPAPAAEPAPIPRDLGESLREIGDPELKAVLEALARGVAASNGPPRVEGDHK
ncbi:DUF721 domain-containing protein [Sphingomonas sanxanigenens]|uniref:DUF721 domain-containing protein n=1 Tax=Sphingomonas sanxanigenens DSM 19645 = NX02 TaxID=1123269 RepID=W0AH28_9SPHN|nr:DUF721 domain-containing protein [Sphingomonas sanxanigenens]AHE56426.1 hypothetical protein NX02_24090 [Sphingomonas sanxanigenens DSM 19645 = NX02]